MDMKLHVHNYIDGTNLIYITCLPHILFLVQIGINRVFWVLTVYSYTNHVSKRKFAQIGC